MGTGGLFTWIQENLITLVVLILGVIVLWTARGGNLGKAVTIIGGVFLGLGVLGLALGNNATQLGSFIVSLFGIG